MDEYAPLILPKKYNVQIALIEIGTKFSGQALISLNEKLNEGYHISRPESHFGEMYAFIVLRKELPIGGEGVE